VAIEFGQNRQKCFFFFFNLVNFKFGDSVTKALEK